MEEQVDLAIQKVKTAVEKAYIDEHELSGMDEYTRRRYKKMLNGLID